MRGERATMGKSLLDVQHDLRIKASYIDAIENCDISAVDKKGFISGYVRSYARYLNMNADECFVRFCAESGFCGGGHGMHPVSAQASRSTSSAPIPIQPPTIDPIAHSLVLNVPKSPGILSHLSLSAVGSVIVLVLLIIGLGYVSWVVLKEVQRVRFVPVNQTPGVNADIPRLPDPAAGQSGNVVAVSPAEIPKPANLNRLYRPQEFELPQMVARDAPISTIEAGSVGAFAEPQVTARPMSNPVEQPPLTVAEHPPPVDVVALKPAWVEVSFDDGSILFSQVLNAGENYRIPPGIGGAKLKTGNAGGTFVKVGETVYGPLGRSGSVVRDVGLSEIALRERFEPAQDVFTNPLAPPLNHDEMQAIVAAPVEAQE